VDDGAAFACYGAVDQLGGSFGGLAEFGVGEVEQGSAAVADVAAGAAFLDDAGFEFVVDGADVEVDSAFGLEERVNVGRGAEFAA